LPSIRKSWGAEGASGTGATLRQRLPDDRGDPIGFLFELAVREAEDRVTALPQIEVAGVVILEGDRALVVGEEVGFDDYLAFGPEEINLVATDLDVGLGMREPVFEKERKEVFLEVAAEAVPLGSFEMDPFVLRLALGAAEEVWRDGAVEVVDRALNRRNGGL
jgi:hypothetical protein